MRASVLFGRTQREDPADVELASHGLLLRAGYIRQLGAGIYSLLPLGLRFMQQIEAIIRDEMAATGAQEISTPVVHPAELWQRSGRWTSVDASLVRFQDRHGRDMVLAMTAEEVMADLAASQITSHRDLPVTVFQIQTKFRDEPRPRAGLIRTREFVMKDAYSLGRDDADLDVAYHQQADAYFRIAQRAGIEVVAVQSSTGDMGGSQAHEFTYLCDGGEDVIVRCSTGDYFANTEVARAGPPVPPEIDAGPATPVATPGASAIDDVAAMLGLPGSSFGKAVCFVPVGQQDGPAIVLALVLGDQTVNIMALEQAVGHRLAPAPASALAAEGLVAGFLSPVGVDHRRVLVVADPSVEGRALIVGANIEDHHLVDAVAGRDFVVDRYAAIRRVEQGDACPRCGASLELVRGIEYGNIFKLGTRYSEALGTSFTDANGTRQLVVMGSYGIGVGRLAACIVEANHDERGLVLPVTVAPFAVALLSLDVDGEPHAHAESAYARLRAAGISVLFDDRAGVRPGARFADADLQGMPLRATVSSRSLAKGGVELRRRSDGVEAIVPLDDLVATVREWLDELGAAAQRPLRRSGDAELLATLT